MLAALVEGLLTTFVYDGRRLQMSVAGEVVTYTLDYARDGRVLLEEGGAFADTKHYLYGLECIAELVDANEPESEWRFYHQDGNHLVRQTTNMAAMVTLAWTYSPEGAVLLGEEGPVTHLGCEGNTTYDFSTGLIFKNGRYFDPNTGIWITLSGMVIYQAWSPQEAKRRNCRRKNRKWLWLCLSLLLISLLLSGCGGGGSSTPPPTETPCPPSNDRPTPSPFPPLTANIGFILVNGTTRTHADIESQIGVANSKLAQAGVTIRNDGIFKLDEMDPSRPNLSKELIGEDLEVDLSPSMHEDVDLFKWGLPTSQATVFYVGAIFPRNDGWTNDSNILIADWAMDRTLPHEIGHVFGLGHPVDESINLHGLMPCDYPKNLMTQSISATGKDELSILQIERLRETIQRGG